jgi:hypothetical protein
MLRRKLGHDKETAKTKKEFEFNTRNVQNDAART